MGEKWQCWRVVNVLQLPGIMHHVGLYHRQLHRRRLRNFALIRNFIHQINKNLSHSRNEYCRIISCYSRVTHSSALKRLYSSKNSVLGVEDEGERELIRFNLKYSILLLFKLNSPPYTPSVYTYSKGDLNICYFYPNICNITKLEHSNVGGK